MPTRRTTRAGRRSRITPTVQEVLCSLLAKQPYIYQCKIYGRRPLSKIWLPDIGAINQSNPAINQLDKKDDPSHRTTAGCQPSRPLSS